MACVPIEASTNTWLSTAACDTRIEPVTPPLPGQYVLDVIGWPIVSPSVGCRMRASESIGPPAANGTTMVSGRVGQSCAVAAKLVAQRATTAKAAANSSFRIRHRCTPSPV